MLGSRLLSVALLVVLLVGLGTAGYLQVAGRAGESSPQAATPPPPSPSPRAEPRAAPTHPSRPAPTPSPTPEPAPSPAEARPPSSEPVPVEPPAGDAYTEDEYRAIYEDLNAGVGWITTRPGFDPEELRIYVSDECPCLNPLLGQFRARQEAGEVVEGIPTTVLSFVLEDVEPDGTFVARVIDQRSPGRVLDQAGTVIAEYGQQSPFESRVWVTPTPQGWRLTGLEYLTEATADPAGGQPT